MTKKRPQRGALYIETQELTRKSKLFTKRRGLVAKSYKQKVAQLAKKVPIDQKAMLLSLQRINQKEQEQNLTEDTAPEIAIRQGIRFALIEQYRQKYEDQKQPLCRILGTTAKEPDPDHVMIEGKILPLNKVLKLLSRYGCQRDFVILE